MLLRLAPNRGSVAHARHWVVRRAAEAGVVGEPGAVVELLTSELVANAVVHGPPDGTITLRTALEDGCFEVAVTDDSPTPPVVRHSDPLDEGGRGMMPIDLMATEWGVQRQDGSSKCVWFRVAL